MLHRLKDDDVQIATADKDVVLRQDKVSLYRYKATRQADRSNVPVLVVYGLVGRYTMADLQEDRSHDRNLLGQGVDLYAVDWGNPTRSDRWLTLEDYIDGYLADASSSSAASTAARSTCSAFAKAACSPLLRGAHPDRVKNLILTITPIDFHADQVEGRTEPRLHQPVDAKSERRGHRPADRGQRQPSRRADELRVLADDAVRELTKYNVGLLDVIDDEKKLLNFLRMEKWLADRPHHPGEAAKQWLIDLYQDNELIQGKFELAGRTVDLANINMPVLNVFAKDDHIIPPRTSQALGGPSAPRTTPRSGLTAATSASSSAASRRACSARASSTGFASATDGCESSTACSRAARNSRSRTGGLPLTAYAEWGSADAARTVVCVHGVSRNGRDFDVLARGAGGTGRARHRARPSRSRAQRLAGRPARTTPTGLPSAMARADRASRRRAVDWVGTSLGGYIGMHLAAEPRNADPPAGPERFRRQGFGSGIAADWRLPRPVVGFETIEEAEAHLRDALAPFGKLSDAQWRAPGAAQRRAGPTGGLRLHFDPAIGAHFAMPIWLDIVLWHVWDKIECPVLILRGEDSDLFRAHTVDADASRAQPPSGQGQRHRVCRLRPRAGVDGPRIRSPPFRISLSDRPKPSPDASEAARSRNAKRVRHDERTRSSRPPKRSRSFAMATR